MPSVPDLICHQHKVRIKLTLYSLDYEYGHADYVLVS
jgi:hypothetical protein